MDDEWNKQTRKRLHDAILKRKKEAETRLEKLRNDAAVLKNEVVKSINGESAFETAMLRELIDENHEAQLSTEQEIAGCQIDVQKEEAKISALATRFKEIKNWTAMFDCVDNDMKKMILSQLVEKITVDRDYHIEVHFYVTMEDFDGRAKSDKQPANN